MSRGTTISVVVPMLNEAEDIETCLEAILAQDHPHDRLEVLVVDGGSTDGSVALVKGALARSDLASWRVLLNPTGITPASLNAGLAAASGAVLCRVDARTLIQPDHVRRCAELLASRPDIAVVGGRQVARPRGADARSQGIARALNNHLSMGGASYRSGAASGPTDTVYLGAFRTAELRDAGGWDERFATNQDFELNRRMAARGVVWFDAHISSGYLARADLGSLYHQYHRFGRWKVRYWRITGDRPLGRQQRLLALPLALAAMAVAIGWWRPGALLPLAGLGGAGVAAVDAAGSSESAPLAVRAWAAVAIVTVGVAWLLGVLRETTRPAPVTS